MLMFFNLTASCLQITTWVKVETDISEWIDIASVNHNSITVFPFIYFTNLRIIHRSLGVASLKRLWFKNHLEDEWVQKIFLWLARKIHFARLRLASKNIIFQCVKLFLINIISATISTIFSKLCTNQIIGAS